MIDFHAHILPNADHGSDGLETSLAQLAAAKAAGITTLVATPHFYPDHHHLSDFLARRKSCTQRLTEAYSGDIAILPGAEVMLCEGLAHLPNLRELCIQDTNVLLVEMPMVTWTQRYINALIDLQNTVDLTVVLAHVDRYPPAAVDMLFAQGFQGQLNADSLCRYIGRRKLLEWVHEDQIVALGSDIHGVSNAYRKFHRAYQLLGENGQPLMNRTNQLLKSTSASPR